MPVEIAGFRGYVEVRDMKTGLVLARNHNTLTETFRSAIADWALGSTPTEPLYIALGAETASSTENPRAFTRLKNEFYRAGGAGTISRVKTADDTTRLAQGFVAEEGTGTIQELGLFSADELAVWVSQCDAVIEPGTGVSWQVDSDGTITLDGADYRQGSGALRSACVNLDAIPFMHSALNVDASTCDGDTAFLQFWYYIDDMADLSAVSSDYDIRVVIGNDSSNYWHMFFNFADIANGWNHISLRLADTDLIGYFTQGSPTLASPLTYFYLQMPHTGDTVEKLDGIRIFDPNGSLYARSEISVVKGMSTVIGVYWYISSKETSDMEYVTFAKETLTVSSVSMGLTSATYAPTGAQQARQATIRVEDAAIRLWTTGDAPDPSASPPEGIVLGEDEMITVVGSQDIANFRCIRDTAVDAVIQVLYAR